MVIDTRTVLTIFASARHGRLEEFRTFYDEVHIPEVLHLCPELISVERYDLARPGSGTHPLTVRPETTPDSVAVYTVAGSAKEVWARIMEDRTMTTSPAFDYKAVRAIREG